MRRGFALLETIIVITFVTVSLLLLYGTFTSLIAKKEKKPTKTIRSPYTLDRKARVTFIPFLVYAVIVILVVSIIYFVVTLNSNDDEFVEGTIITESR